jgi:hypothetical protein
LFLGGCETPGDSSNGVPNNITGEVIIRNVDSSDAAPVLTDRAGVRVWLHGTNISAITDASGKYTLSAVPPGLYTLGAAREGLDTLITNVEYSGVGIEFMTPLHMYTLTKGQITLDPILRLTARELYRHPQANQMSITDSVNFNGDTTYHLKNQIHLLPNDTVVVFTGIEQFVTAQERPLVFGSDERDSYSGSFGVFKEGDRYFRVYYVRSLDEFIEKKYQNDPPPIRLYTNAGRQKVWSNPQPFPVK